jgi:hypothetical protein
MNLPKLELKWGEDMPPAIMEALKRGDGPALLRDPDGNPYSLVIIDSLGTIREMILPSND